MTDTTEDKVLAEDKRSADEKIADSNPLERELEACAQMLGMYLPVFKARVSNLSGRQAKRLCKNLVEYPLAEDEYAPKEQHEKDAFLMGERLLQAKMMLMIYTQQKAIEKHMVEVEAGKHKEETSNLTKQEVGKTESSKEENKNG